MEKVEQTEINETIEYYINLINEDCDACGTRYVGKLRTCSAAVYETHDWYLLQSYNTIVAAVNKENYIRLDFLRWAYGYTATSAQHISKFFHDYVPYGVNSDRLTWRAI